MDRGTLPCAPPPGPSSHTCATSSRRPPRPSGAPRRASCGRSPHTALCACASASYAPHRTAHGVVPTSLRKPPNEPCHAMPCPETAVVPRAHSPTGSSRRSLRAHERVQRAPCPSRAQTPRRSCPRPAPHPAQHAIRSNTITSSTERHTARRQIGSATRGIPQWDSRAEKRRIYTAPRTSMPMPHARARTRPHASKRTQGGVRHARGTLNSAHLLVAQQQRPRGLVVPKAIGEQPQRHKPQRRRRIRLRRYTRRWVTRTYAHARVACVRVLTHSYSVAVTENRHQGLRCGGGSARVRRLASRQGTRRAPHRTPRTSARPSAAPARAHG